VRDVGSDFRAFYTRPDTYRILGLGLVGSLSFSPLDDDIRDSRFNNEPFDGGRLDVTFEAGDAVGGTLVQVGGALATYGVGAMLGRSGVSDLGRDLIRAQLLAATITQPLKYIVGRERPDGSSHTSFPSGHTSGTFATATVLLNRYGWKAGAPAYAVASYVAASRLSENKHFLSDVVFGAVVGISAGRVINVARGSTRFEVTPMAAPGLVGAQVVITKR
jgi:membrane-associated phospholipid phosphatase